MKEVQKQMELYLPYGGKKITKRKIFYILLAILLSACFVDYVFGVNIPPVVMLIVPFLMALTGDTDEIAAVCICCIPLHTYLEYAFVILFCIICHVVKNADKIRITSAIVPVFLMILWELLHCFTPELNIMQFGGHCVSWLLLAVLMCTTKHRYDYGFIARAFALTTAIMCFSLIGRLLYTAHWNLADMMLRLQRLGVEAETGTAKINPNTLGILCVFGVTGLLQLRTSGIRRKGDLLLSILLLLFGIMTASRTFLVCLLFMAVLFICTAGKGMARRLKNVMIAIGAGIVVIAICYMIMPDLLKYFVSRFFEKDITTGRVDTMGEYHKLLLSNLDIFVFGIGLQDFSNRVLQLCPQAIFVPHNGLQELILAWGLPGIAFFISLWCLMVSRSREHNNRQRLLNYIPFLVLLLKTVAGQMVNSAYTMLMFSYVYLSMGADFSAEKTVNTAEHLIPANTNERGISLPYLIKVLWKRKLQIVAVTICCALTAFFVTKYFITPMYQSTVLFYVNNKNITTEKVTAAITNSDLLVSRVLVNTYSTVLKSRETINEAAALCGIAEPYETLKEMVMTSAVNETEVLKMVVTHPDPIQAQQLANAIAEVFSKRISEVIDGTSIKLIDYAIAAQYPSSPSKAINTLVGGVIGFVAIAMLLLLQTERNRKIDVTELTAMFPYPVLGEIPELGTSKNIVSNWKENKIWQRIKEFCKRS